MNGWEGDPATEPVKDTSFILYQRPVSGEKSSLYPSSRAFWKEHLFFKAVTDIKFLNGVLKESSS